MTVPSARKPSAGLTPADVTAPEPDAARQGSPGQGPSGRQRAVSPWQVDAAASSPRPARHGRHVLIVEDERDLAELLRINLEAAGYSTAWARDGRTALHLAREQRPDAIILDLMIPEMHGTEVARRIRTDSELASLPIVMLTAKSQEQDQLVGLAAGADDYITKPFSMRVVLARLDAVLRRAVERASERSARGDLRLGPILVDPAGYSATLDGREIPLTRTEFRILLALVQSGGRVLPREELVRRALGPGVAVTERTIDVHMTSIRRKLGPAGALIKTVRGVGYRTAPEHPQGE